MRQPVAAQARYLRSLLGNLGQTAAIWWAVKWGWAVETGSVPWEQEELWHFKFILVTWMQFCLKCTLFSLLSLFLKNVLADCISRWQSIVILGPRLCLRTAILNTQAPLLGTWEVHLSGRLRTFRTGLHLALCLPPLLLPSSSFSSLPSFTAHLCFRSVHWMAFPAFPYLLILHRYEECATQFLVVKFATVSSGQTSPYCGSCATLCWSFFLFFSFCVFVCVDLSNVKNIKFKEWVCLVLWCHLSKFEVSFTKQLSNFIEKYINKNGILDSKDIKPEKTIHFLFSYNLQSQGSHGHNTCFFFFYYKELHY